MNLKGFRLILRCIAGAIILHSVHVQAQTPFGVTVTDIGYSYFSIDPVNIVTGEAVYWVADSNGPYVITSSTGAWQSFGTPGGILFTTAGSYSYFDDTVNTGTVNVTPNIPPTVSITAPTNQTVLASPATFNFTADAADTDVDGLSDVQFYVGSNAGTNLVADITAAPFTTTITNLAVGTYILTAIAIDNVGATTTNQISITVNGSISIPPIALAAPRMVAGTFQFDLSGLTIGKTNIVETTTNLSSATWIPLVTNVASSTTMTYTNPTAVSLGYFQVIQLP